jgi:hypothetical protein
MRPGLGRSSVTYVEDLNVLLIQLFALAFGADRKQRD